MSTSPGISQPPLYGIGLTSFGAGDSTGSSRRRINVPSADTWTSKQSPGFAAGNTTRFLSSAVTVTGGIIPHGVPRFKPLRLEMPLVILPTIPELPIGSRQGLEFLVYQGILVPGWHPPPHATLDCEPTRASLQAATGAPLLCSIFPAWNGTPRNTHKGST